uniref:RRM domain-containing protein n=1 Tax=Rhabditophanes sp. KR3021 TaxID=114890 RepID=A0AC35TZZ0_9BILA
MSFDYVGIPETKKFRDDWNQNSDDYLNQTAKSPSKVVHIKNVAPSTTEADFLEALHGFGVVAYATVMPHKRMALVEFESIQSANKCVTETLSNPILIKGQQLSFSFSTSQYIQRNGLESEKPNKVLCLTILNSTHPITCDLIEKICHDHAKVLRIFIIRKIPIHVLVEFESISDARNVKLIINGADIYQDCCTLKVEYAKSEYVKVQYNSKDAFDYTCDKPERTPNNHPSYHQQPQAAVNTQNRGRSNEGGGGIRGAANYKPPTSYDNNEYNNHHHNVKPYISEHPPASHVPYESRRGSGPPQNDRWSNQHQHKGGPPTYNNHAVPYNDNPRPHSYPPKPYDNSDQGGPPHSYRGNNHHPDDNNGRKYDPPTGMSRRNDDYPPTNGYNCGGSSNYRDGPPPRDVYHDMDHPPAAGDHRRYDQGPPPRKPLNNGAPYEDRFDSRSDYQKNNHRDGMSSRGGPPSNFSDRDNGGRRSNDSFNKKPMSRDGSRYDDREYDNRRGGNAVYDRPPYEDRHKPADQGNVIMIYGVNHENFNCDKLFNLLCPYGNVLRVKFMRSKQDTCMVEMQCHNELNNVIKHLHNLNIMGSTLAFRHSKQHNLKGTDQPFDMIDGSPSFKDFSCNKYQRYNTQEMAVKNRLAFPSGEIHWFNAPPDVTDQQIVEAFRLAGAPKPLSISKALSRHGGSTSGTCKFNNSEEAAEALATANHVPIYSPNSKFPFVLKMAFNADTSTTRRAPKREYPSDNNDYSNYKVYYLHEKVFASKNLSQSFNIGRKELDTRFDHVVVTAALGHLKAFHRHLFEPALPRHRQHVIETIGFGGSCKIFFVYERPFWPKEYRAISPLPIKDCNRKGQVNSIESELTTFEVVDWAPNVLTAWIAGHGPTKMDDLTDQQLSNHVTTLFRDMFINASIPAPQNIIRRLWHKNDLFNGSYSYVSKEQAAQNIHHWELSIPVKVNKVPRILFAGEATHHRIFQTAVGAYMSGIREVERLNYFYST